ncbi:Putative acid--amine ligase YjfC [Methylobacterium hispanicum]|jgi:glutathionylspermidine synthase|uniref:Acid--amine ligase YjfC n=1 Tax=Methylobacterium hispanicum TaxID=270350 RepID=A0AAV4ZVZ6_9HYPH|nr:MULTISPECIES: glutathionylspermidine synthase family protein [Methylobacterium]GJD92319.1 Putative acid--amine ligase YjfC [Methylobacterium hispanicum]
MRRVATGARPDWRDTARARGFVFHTLDGAPYWDESHAYAFGLDEIEAEIEGPSGELHALCLAFVGRAVADERILARLRVPETAWDAIRASWRRGDPSLYGRLDLAYGGTGPAKLLEYNADTPTALYETGVFQWLWLEEALRDRRLPAGADQYNAVHERLIARFRAVAGPGLLAFTADARAPEDRGTVAYLEDCAVQAGCRTAFADLPDLGLQPGGGLCTRAGAPIETLFKLYPWEWAFADPFGAAVGGAPTRFLEPPWKMLLSNKGLLPCLWALEPGHPNLLPAYFEDDPEVAALGRSYARKPLFSREGANVSLVRDGTPLVDGAGPYGAEGFVRQALAELPAFDGRRALVGSWIVGDEPAGLCLRESDGLVTGDDALFVPHFIEPT